MQLQNILESLPNETKLTDGQITKTVEGWKSLLVHFTEILKEDMELCYRDGKAEIKYGVISVMHEAPA